MVALYRDPKGNKVMKPHQAEGSTSLASGSTTNPTEEVEVLRRKITQQHLEQEILRKKIASLEVSSSEVCL